MKQKKIEFLSNLVEIYDNFEYEGKEINEIRKTLDDYKTMLDENEKEIFEESILEITELASLTEWELFWKGVKFWIERKKLEKYVKKNLTKHSELNQRIIGRLERKKKIKKEELEEEETIYYEIGKPEELLENAEKGKVNEVAIEMIEKLEQDVVIHLEANKKGAEKTWNKELLIEENRETKMLLKASQEEAEKEKARNKKLQQELEEIKGLLGNFQEENEKQLIQNRKLNQKNLEEKNKTKELEKKVNLLNKLLVKDLSSLPKKENKFKILGIKTRTKFQHLVEKVKKQSQELIARVEVKVK